MVDPKNSDNLENDSQSRLFLDLLLKHQKRIYNFILILVPNYNDADDIMQETVYVMWSKFSEFEIGTNFTAWAIRIARNKTMNFRRKNGRSPNQFSPEALSQIITESRLLFENRQVRVDALQKCLLKLKEYDRYLISLRYEQENPVKKIAEITGRSADGLYHTMARIHKTLLQCIHRTLNVWETAK